MRGVLIGPAVLACALLAGCGGSSNTTIINNNQTTVTSAGSTATSTTAATTAATTATTPPPTRTTTTTKTTSTEADEPEQGPIPCGAPGVVTSGTAGTADAPATPGYQNLEAEGISCAVASSIATAWARGWDEACARGCVRVVGDLHCRYGGSGSPVACFAGKSELSFELSFLAG